MKSLLKFIFFFVVTIALNSCSRDEDNTTEKKPTIVGKWEFSKSIIYNAQNQEELIDYTHKCSTNKDFLQFTTRTMNDSYSQSNCQSDTDQYSYIVDKDVIRFYKGQILTPYSLKIISLTDEEFKVQWISNSTGNVEPRAYVLIRKKS